MPKAPTIKPVKKKTKGVSSAPTPKVVKKKEASLAPTPKVVKKRETPSAPTPKKIEKGTRAVVRTAYKTGDLRDPNTYTPEEIEASPTRALLARTVGVEDRLASPEDLWWKGAHNPFDEDSSEWIEMVRLQGGGGDKNLFYYAGAPNEVDNFRGWARPATLEEKRRDLALLKKRGLEGVSPPDLAWKDEASREAAMKERFSEEQLGKDRDRAEAFVTEWTKIVEDEQSLQDEINTQMEEVFRKYNTVEGEALPETHEAQRALMKRIADEGSEEEKELIQFGWEYFEKTRGVLGERLAERNEGYQILSQLTRVTWARPREKQVEAEMRRAASARGPMGGDLSVKEAAQQVVSTRLVKDEEGRLVPSQEVVAMTSKGPRVGVTYINPAEGEVMPGFNWVGDVPFIESLDISYVGSEEGRPIPTHETAFKGKSFGEIAHDPELYQQALDLAAGELDPDVVRGLIAHKRAQAILAHVQGGKTQYEERGELRGPGHLQMKKVAVGGVPPETERWAREVVFYREVLENTQQRVHGDLIAAAEYAGVSPEVMAEVSLSRKLYASGKDVNKTAFDYTPVLELIRDHQADLISQHFGMADHADAAGRQMTVGEFTNGDLSKLQYYYTDSLGNEVPVGTPPSRSNMLLSNYISEIATTRAKTIIKKDLHEGRGMAFVKEMTSDQRAQQARASGVPFLYMIAVPRGKGQTLGVTPEGEFLASGEFFEDYSVMDHTMQVFNGLNAYGGALGKELWRSGTIDDISRFMTTDSGDFNWSSLGLQQTQQHAVRSGETLEDISAYYWGDRDNFYAKQWVSRQRESLGLSEGEQPPKGTSLTVHRDVFDVLDKATAVAMGLSEDSQVWAEMDRHWDLMATEQLFDLAAWSAEGLDVWGDPDLATKTAVLGTLYGAAGVYLDVRAPDPFTGTLVVGGKSVQAWKGYHRARQTKRTISELRTATDDATDMESLLTNLERISPGADAYFQARVAHSMGVDENIVAQLRSVESQLERERLLLRKAEMDAEDFRIDVDKANAQARIDATRVRIAELEHQQFTQRRDIYRGQIDALEQRGARKAVDKYKKEVAAAEQAKLHEELSHKELEAFENGVEYSAYTAGLENHRNNIQGAVENETQARTANAAVKKDVRVVIDDLRVQKRILDGQLRELKAQQRLELNKLDADFAAKRRPLPDAEWIDRADRAGLTVHLDSFSENLSSWKKKVRRAENKKRIKGHLDGDPSTIKKIEKERRAAEAARRNELAALKKTQKEALKKKHAREKAPVEEELKATRDDIKALTWTKRSQTARPTGRKRVEQLLSARDTAANRLTDAVSKTKRQRERSRAFLRDESTKKLVKTRQTKRRKAALATKAHARLTGRAWSKLVSFAPGLSMSVLTKREAVQVIEDTLEDLRRAERAMDDEIVAVRKTYKDLLRTRKDAKLSAKEAEQSLDSLIRSQDRQARLETNIKGFEEQKEVWRKIALKIADELEEGNQLMKKFPDESPRYEDPLARGTVSVNTKTGERVIDPKKLRVGLDEKYSAAAVEHFLRAEPEMSRPLARLLGRVGEVAISGDQVSTLQQMQAGLLRAREAVHPQAEAIATVRAIAQAKGDVDMMRVAMASSNHWKAAGNLALGVLGFNPDWWPTYISRITRALSPIKNRIGPISGEQVRVLKAADLGAAMINEDMRLISRAAHGGKLPGGADGTALEMFSASKQVENSKKAVGLYYDLVDGKVTIVSTRPLREVERPELIATLENEIKALSEEISEVERKIKVEKEIPGETLLQEELESTARSLIEKRSAVDDLITKERALHEKMESFRRELLVEANGYRAEAAALEAATTISDAEHAVFNNYKAAMVAREAGDEVLSNRRMLQAAEAAAQLGQFSKTELPDLKKSLVFSDAQETILRNAHAAVEHKLLEPDRLRAQADELLEGLDQGTHPRQDVFNDLRTRLNAASSERALAQQDLAGTEKRLEQLKKEHLPEDLQRTLTGRQQVTRLQHELKQAEAELSVRLEDLERLDKEVAALEIQVAKKAEDVVSAVEAAQVERAKLSPRVLAGDEEAVLEMADVDRRLDALLKEREIFAKETPDGWKANLEQSNPLILEEEKLYAQIEDLETTARGLESHIEDTLRPTYDAAIKEHGWSSLTTTAEHMLRAERKTLLQKKANAEALLKESSAKPSWQEVEDFLSASDQGEELGHLHAQLVLAGVEMSFARKTFENLPGEHEFYEKMIELAISEKRADLHALLVKALPKPGKVSSVTERMGHARAMAQLLEERPLYDTLLETAQRMPSAEAAGFGAAADRLAKTERSHAKALQNHSEAKAAYEARRKALLAGDEPLPLGDRKYANLVTKKNIPIPVAGRTTASNTGLTVPWDEAVHQWKSTDLAGLEERLRAASQMPGHFGSALKANGISEAFMGLSRMWVPRKINLTQYHQSKLLGDAARILVREDVLTFRHFADRMRAATFKTLKDASGVSEKHMDMLAAQSAVLEHEHSIAMGAYNVMRASLLKRTNDNLVRTIGATFTSKQARAMNAFLGAEKGIRSVPEEAWHDVIEGLNRLGTPLTQTYVRPSRASGLGETTTRLMATGATDEGAAVWMREDLVQAIDDIFIQATKRADRFYRADITEGLPLNKMKNGLSQAYSFWKQSVTSGLILPNPGYWMNNVIGDFSQMYFAVGLGTAAKLSANNLPTNIPILGKYWHDWVATMAKGTEKVPVLGTLTNALFNPHLARIWNRQPGHVVFKGGQTASYDDVYRWAVEDGVVDSIIQEEFLGLLQRTQTDKITSAFKNSKKILGDWQEDVLLFADFAQKRQRMGLYVELLKQGKTREEAARLTLNALYDWRHGVAKWEAAYIVAVSPFWRFWKNALKQVGRVATDPLTKPDKVISELLASGLGGTQAGAGAGQRMRQALFLEEHGPELLYDTFVSDEEAMVTIEQGVKDAEIAARHFMGSHLYDYMFYGASTLSPERRAFFDEERPGPFGTGMWEDDAGILHGIVPGRSKYPSSGAYDADYAYTHSYTVGPKWSTLEAMSIWAMTASWFVTASYAAQQSVVGSDEDIISDDLIEDYFLQPALKLSGPHSQLAIEGLSALAGLKQPDFSISGRFQHYNNSSSLNPGEAYFLSIMGVDIEPEVVSKDEEADPEVTGRYRSKSQVAVYMMRNIPFVLQVPTKVNQAYFRNPDIQNGLWPALWTGAQQVGALPWKESFADPRYAISSRQWDISRALIETKEALEEERRKKTFAVEHAGKKKISERNIAIIEERESIPTAPPVPDVDPIEAFRDAGED